MKFNFNDCDYHYIIWDNFFCKTEMIEDDQEGLFMFSEERIFLN